MQRALDAHTLWRHHTTWQRGRIWPLLCGIIAYLSVRRVVQGNEPSVGQRSVARGVLCPSWLFVKGKLTLLSVVLTRVKVNPLFSLDGAVTVIVVRAGIASATNPLTRLVDKVDITIFSFARVCVGREPTFPVAGRVTDHITCPSVARNSSHNNSYGNDHLPLLHNTLSQDIYYYY